MGFTLWEVFTVSIVRIGLAETKKFAEGYSAIFGARKKEAKPKAKAEGTKKPGRAGKKKGKK
jgi:hypothetical protein